jgi:cytoskeleton protein RodZ
MGDFGENLKQERKARGISLEDISAATKISVRLLQAIENEEFERLPGGIFNVNFVRQYARYLGLDEEKIVSDFRRLTTPVPEPEAAAPRPALVPPEWTTPRPSEYDWDYQRNSRLWMMATFLVAILSATAFLYIWLSGRRAAPPPAASVAAPARAPTAVAAAPAAAPAEPASSEGRPAAPAPPPKPAETPHTDAAAKTPSSAVPEEKAGSTARPTAAPAPPSSGPAVDLNAPLRVELQATDPVWVGATADGRPSFQATLQPQESRIITAQSVVRLRVGNAGGLHVIFNGQAEPSIGPKGQVRTVVITREGMRVISPPVEEQPAALESGVSGGADADAKPQAQPAKAPVEEPE